MPLSFANPALLFGALAAALPVIIHFLSRRKVRREKFSDLRFLSEVQARQTRRLTMRRWLLLLLRVLAILLLVLAVAGPRWGGLGGGLAGHSVLMVIDTSASMGTHEQQGTRLARAIEDCRGMIAMLPGRTSVQILTAGAQVTPLLGDWLPAGAVPLDVLRGVSADGGGFDFEAVLEEAVRQVRSAPGTAVDLVLFSDLQKVRRKPDLQTVAARLQAELPVRLLVRRIGHAVPQGGVLKVELPARALRPGENIALRARVIPDAPDQPFTLEIDGVEVGEAVSAGPVSGIHALDFSLTVPGPGLHRGLVRKPRDRLPADDVRYFILRVPEKLKVVLVHGADHPGDGPAGRGGWRFLQQALDPGGRGAPFEVQPVTCDKLVTGDLDRAGVLVLVDPDPLGRTALAGLTAWVRGGGGVLVMAGDPTLADYLQQTLLPALGFPGQKVRFRSRDTGLAMRLVSRRDPLLAGFGKEALGTLEDVHWQRWYALQEQGSRVLLSLSGGDPLVFSRVLEAGRVMIMAGDLRPEAGDLAVSAMALPLLQRMVSWLGAQTARSAGDNITVGQPVVLTPPAGWVPGSDLSGLMVMLPGGAKPQPAVLEWNGTRPTLRGGIPTRPGFAVFTADGDTLGQVAVAIPGSESGVALEDPAAWQSRLGVAGLTVAGDLSDAAPAQLGSLLRGRDLAPWLFLLAAAVLMLELYLGRGATSSVAGSG